MVLPLQGALAVGRGGVVGLVPLSSVRSRRPDVRGSLRFRWGERLPYGWIRCGESAAAYWARPRCRNAAA